MQERESQRVADIIEVFKLGEWIIQQILHILMPPKAGFDPSKYVTSTLKVEDVQKMKDCFDVFDHDGGGSVSVDELIDTVKVLGIEDQADLLLSIVNSSGHVGDMDFGTYLSIFAGDNGSDVSLQSLFEAFDTTGAGSFGPEEFDRVAKEVGEHFSVTEVEEMIDFADKDRDGLIGYQEFLDVVTKEYPRA